MQPCWSELATGLTTSRYGEAITLNLNYSSDVAASEGDILKKDYKPPPRPFKTHYALERVVVQNALHSSPSPTPPQELGQMCERNGRIGWIASTSVSHWILHCQQRIRDWTKVWMRELLEQAWVSGIKNSSVGELEEHWIWSDGSELGVRWEAWSCIVWMVLLWSWQWCKSNRNRSRNRIHWHLTIQGWPTLFWGGVSQFDSLAFIWNWAVLRATFIHLHSKTQFDFIHIFPEFSTILLCRSMFRFSNISKNLDDVFNQKLTQEIPTR